MAIQQGATNTFKLGLPKGNFDFDVDTFKIALYAVQRRLVQTQLHIQLTARPWLLATPPVAKR